MLETKFPHLIWVPCAAHTSELVLDDIVSHNVIALLVELVDDNVKLLKLRRFRKAFLDSQCEDEEQPLDERTFMYEI